MSAPDRYAVLGHPVGHSRSPFIHERFAKQTSQNLVYTAIDVTPVRLSAVVREFFAGGGKGLNITVPHKQAVVPLAQDLTPRAARAGAVNTLSLRPDGSLLGDNTDGAGLVRDLLNNLGITIAGRSVLLLGAGGAARGVVAPLLGLKPRGLTIANRTKAKALELAKLFADMGDVRGCGYPDLRGEPYDLVINASAASLATQLPPLPPGIVNTRSVCYDLAYGREDTVFLRWAQERGCTRTAMGLGMLIEQAAESFFGWRGIRPDTASVLAALKVELARDK
ncbi:MAG: shikimate dehydrogenase [Pseudomonadota bacterium]